MRKFWNSYMELCKHDIGWLKEHWKGYILMSIMLYAVVAFGFFGWLCREMIVEKIKSIFTWKDSSEEDLES